MAVALMVGMSGVNDFQDLSCWQLASDLCAEVYRVTERGRVTRDVKYRNQIRDSAASAPRNIADGWGRYYPNQNAPYVRIAKSSLDETVNHLLHGNRQKYFSKADFAKIYRLAKRALGATTAYLLYLDSCGKDPVPPSKPDLPSPDSAEQNENPEPKNPEPKNPNL
jgi:four helix bundle protein